MPKDSNIIIFRSLQLPNFDELGKQIENSVNKVVSNVQTTVKNNIESKKFMINDLLRQIGKNIVIIFLKQFLYSK